MTGTARRSTLGWAFVAVLALALGGLALALADQGVNRARTDTHHDIPSAADELPIPSGAIFGAREQLAADSSAGGGPDLWSFTRVGPAVRVQHWIVTPSAVSSQPASLCTSPPVGPLYAAVASWPGVSRALVLAAERSDFIVIQVRRAVPPFVMIAHARTPALPLKTGDTRSIFVDRDRRGYAELIVVDRPATEAGVMRIRVLKGETNFQSVAREVSLDKANSWPRSEWNLVVGGVDSMSGDLLFISGTQPTRTGKIEIHALLSSRGYQGYGLQLPIDSPEGTGVGWSYVLAHGHGGTPFLYGIDPTTHRLIRFPLSQSAPVNRSTDRRHTSSPGR